MKIKTSEEWTREARRLLYTNRCPKHLGMDLQYVNAEKNEACLFLEWKDELGQLPENPIYSGITIMGLADLTACIAAVPHFGNFNVVTAWVEHFKFRKAAPAGRTLLARSVNLEFNDDPKKPEARVAVDVFVKDYDGKEEYVVASGMFVIRWLGGPVCG
jgi:hypothetical protein